MIAYFTDLVGEHCSQMMINRTLEHKHHNVLMISSLLFVNAFYPNVVTTVFFKAKFKTFSRFFQDFQPISWIRLNNKIKTYSLS